MNRSRPLPHLQKFHRKIPLTHWILYIFTWISLVLLAIGTVWALKWTYTGFVVAFEKIPR